MNATLMIVIVIILLGVIVAVAVGIMLTLINGRRAVAAVIAGTIILSILAVVIYAGLAVKPRAVTNPTVRRPRPIVSYSSSVGEERWANAGTQSTPSVTIRDEKLDAYSLRGLEAAQHSTNTVTHAWAQEVAETHSRMVFPSDELAAKALGRELVQWFTSQLENDDSVSEVYLICPSLPQNQMSVVDALESELSNGLNGITVRRSDESNEQHVEAARVVMEIEDLERQVAPWCTALPAHSSFVPRSTKAQSALAKAAADPNEQQRT